jgi:P2-related tail formation protein
VEIHRIRGTVGAVIRALETLGYEVRLDERTGAPYCFRVLLDVDGKAYEEADYDAAERAVLTAKNARSHLTGVVASIARTGVLYTGAAVADGQTTVIKYAEKPKPLHLEFTTSAVRVSPLWMQMDYHATPADDDV